RFRIFPFLSAARQHRILNLYLSSDRRGRRRIWSGPEASPANVISQLFSIKTLTATHPFSYSDAYSTEVSIWRVSGTMKLTPLVGFRLQTFLTLAGVVGLFFHASSVIADSEIAPGTEIPLHLAIDRMLAATFGTQSLSRSDDAAFIRRVSLD